MGVPADFLNKYNPDQFEIVGTSRQGLDGGISKDKDYSNFLNKKKDGKSAPPINKNISGCAMLVMDRNDPKKENYYIDEKTGKKIRACHIRVFIKHKRVVDPL